MKKFSTQSVFTTEKDRALLESMLISSDEESLPYEDGPYPSFADCRDACRTYLSTALKKPNDQLTMPQYVHITGEKLKHRGKLWKTAGLSIITAVSGGATVFMGMDAYTNSLDPTPATLCLTATLVLASLSYGTYLLGTRNSKTSYNRKKNTLWVGSKKEHVNITYMKTIEAHCLAAMEGKNDVVSEALATFFTKDIIAESPLFPEQLKKYCREERRRNILSVYSILLPFEKRERVRKAYALEKNPKEKKVATVLIEAVQHSAKKMEKDPRDVWALLDRTKNPETKRKTLLQYVGKE